MAAALGNNANRRRTDGNYIGADRRLTRFRKSGPASRMARRPRRVAASALTSLRNPGIEYSRRAECEDEWQRPRIKKLSQFRQQAI